MIVSTDVAGWFVMFLFLRFCLVYCSDLPEKTSELSLAEPLGKVLIHLSVLEPTLVHILLEPSCLHQIAALILQKEKYHISELVVT